VCQVLPAELRPAEVVVPIEQRGRAEGIEAVGRNVDLAHVTGRIVIGAHGVAERNVERERHTVSRLQTIILDGFRTTT
jgi:hypothetical protein